MTCSEPMACGCPEIERLPPQSRWCTQKPATHRRRTFLGPTGYASPWTGARPRAKRDQRGNFMAGLTATGSLSGAERGTLHVILWGALTAAVVAWCLAGVQIYGIWVGDPVLSVSLLNSFFPEVGEDNPGVLAGQYETASLTVS